MSLEEEIKQDRFDSIYEKLGISLMISHSWYTSQLKAVLRQFDLSPEQYNVLRILKGANSLPVTVGYVKERMIDKGSNVTRLIDKMELKQWVTRDLNPNSRRQMDLNITKSGSKLADSVRPHMLNLVKVLESLSTAESEQLIKLLDKMRN